MAFQLDHIVPWGRSLAEYRAMFSLTSEDLGKKILGCADGPASFNAELTHAGGRVVSFDPVYEFAAEDIKQRVEEVAPEIYEKVKDNRLDFVWQMFQSPEDLLQKRLQAMSTFVHDFEKGREQGRYVPAQVDSLPFKDDSFDLVVCSHFLFLYGKQLSYEYHLSAILELIRLAPEIRIFPVLELGNLPSRHIERLGQQLAIHGHHLYIETVEYEFQLGANQMAVIRRNA